MTLNNHLCVAIVAATAISMVSCIKEEPLNAECDILEVTLPDNILNRAPIIENNKITLIVKNDVSLLQPLAPEFRLTAGATIDPPSGTPRNFLFPQSYTVTSEDGEWHKTYTVDVQKNNIISLAYSFEQVREIPALGGACKYDEFFEIGTNGKETLVWASANSAYALSLQASTPNTFPTYQSNEGYEGKCVTLTTRSTGSWGARLKKPIAAGNLFIGNFDSQSAVTRPLEATRFGTPFYNEPVSFSGYYKYTPGETYCETDADGNFTPVAGKTDMFNLYVVMYETSPQLQWLDGTNILDRNNMAIIGSAEIPDRHASDEWVSFSVPFTIWEGRSIDEDKLKEGMYNISVVMCSSQDGDFFSGAIGSTLWVDELLISCKSDK